MQPDTSLLIACDNAASKYPGKSAHDIIGKRIAYTGAVGLANKYAEKRDQTPPGTHGPYSIWINEKTSLRRTSTSKTVFGDQHAHYAEQAAHWEARAKKLAYQLRIMLGELAWKTKK